MVYHVCKILRKKQRCHFFDVQIIFFKLSASGGFTPDHPIRSLLLESAGIWGLLYAHAYQVILWSWPCETYKSQLLCL